MVTRELRPYAILTTNSNRIEVQARNLEDAYRKARRELIRIKKEDAKYGYKGMTSKDENLTEAYETFGREGISLRGFIVTPQSIKFARKYRFTVGARIPALNVLYGNVQFGG
jgi:hypothetical protein